MANNFRRTVHHSLQIDIASGTKTIQNTPSITPEPWPPSPLTPAFELDFTAGTFPSSVTFSRASSATCVNAGGYIDYAPNNQLLWSNQLDNGVWSSSDVTLAVNGTSPSGSAAWEMTVTGSSNELEQVFAITNTEYNVFSFDCKMGSGVDADVIYFYASGLSGYNAGLFNMVTGLFISAFSPFADVNAVYLGSNWWRVSGVTSYPVYVCGCSQTNNAGSSYPAIGSSCFVSNFQFEYTYGGVARPYKQTTATIYEGPRIDYDPITLECKGLLIEEQRTNFLPYSNFENDFYTIEVTSAPNSSLSPNNTNTAVSIVPTTNFSTHLFYSVLNPSATVLSYSVYVKSNGYNQIALRESATGGDSAVFNLSTGTVDGVYNSGGTTISNPQIIAAGNGWYRISMTCTLAAAQSFGIVPLDGGWTSGDPFVYQYAGDGTSGFYVWGAQFEEGEFATSYIPTTSTATTREQDIAIVTGTNFSSWYNANVGTFLSQFDGPALGNRSILMADDNTVNDSINLATSGTSGKFIVKDGGVTQVDLTAGTVAAFTQYKIASAYQLNNFATSLAGGAAVTDTNGTIPTVDRMQIGFDPSGNYINGHIASIKYWNIRLDNSTIQTLTT